MKADDRAEWPIRRRRRSRTCATYHENSADAVIHSSVATHRARRDPVPTSATCRARAEAIQQRQTHQHARSPAAGTKLPILIPINSSSTFWRQAESLRHEGQDRRHTPRAATNADRRRSGSPRIVMVKRRQLIAAESCAVSLLLIGEVERRDASTLMPEADDDHSAIGGADHQSYERQGAWRAWSRGHGCTRSSKSAS